jgi:hypothetical protein
MFHVIITETELMVLQQTTNTLSQLAVIISPLPNWLIIALLLVLIEEFLFNDYSDLADLNRVANNSYVSTRCLVHILSSQNLHKRYINDQRPGPVSHGCNADIKVFLYHSLIP